MESDLVYWIFRIVKLFLSNFLPVKMSNKTKKKSVHLLREGLARETGSTIQDMSPGLRNKQPVLLLLL